MKETWKDIPGYEGLYEISDLGRVKSLPKKRKARHGLIQIKERILKPALTRKYEVVSLKYFGKSKTFYIHQLVAIAFLNHQPKGYHLVVDHIDFNCLNNRLDNLQIISHRENTTRSRIGGTSMYPGVCWDKSAKKWRSAIYLNGRNKTIGNFTNELDAAKAYQNELKYA